MPIPFSSAKIIMALTTLTLHAHAVAGATDLRSLAAEKSCRALEGIRIPAWAIGLPTRGATVTRTEAIAARAEGATPAGHYCKVMASIHPLDPAAPQLNFQLDLPTRWNGKAMMLGGGGFDGTIRDPAGNVPHGSAVPGTPLARGYATWNSDSGHQAAPPYVGAYASLDGRFGLNEEAVNNFAGEFIKKTRDAAVFLMRIRYLRSPSRTYFAGGSSGGREAMIAVQRYPRDFDGAIAWYPAWNAAPLNLQFGRVARALAKPGAYPDIVKRNLLYDAVIATCDQQDGLRDGIVSNVDACHFNPQTLRCPDGVDSANSCLSDAQIGAFNTYATPIDIRYPLDSGEQSYPGFDVYAGIDTAGVNPVATLLTWNTAAPTNPATLDMPYFAQFWDMWIRYFVLRDPTANALLVDPENPGALQARIARLAGRQDVVSTDLSAFSKRGGKLLIAHGAADALVNVRASADYYRRLVATMGSGQAESFVRYYQVPGFGHVFGRAFTATWDSLSALEAWAERGVAPAMQVVADANPGNRNRTRPLCPYPAWPRYKGSGDPDRAMNFDCVR